MKRIDISVLQTNTMEWEKIGSVILENGAIRFEGMDERSIREYFDFGVVGLGKDGQLFPSDGEKFLHALYLQCNRSTLVRASTPVEVEATSE